MPSHIRSAAVHLGWILAGKAAAAMAALAAIGIHNDFTAGQAAISHGTSDHKPTCRIDKIARITVGHFRRNDFLYHFFDDRLFQIVIGHIRFMLGRYHHRIHPFGSPVFIFNGHLGFSVGS